MRDDLRAIETEFGFRYMKQEIKSRIRSMALEIFILRNTVKRDKSVISTQAERIRELELSIADLDYKYRG